LATQALIKNRSKAKYYSPHEENQEDTHGGNGDERDELGLVRAICVKVCMIIKLKLVVLLKEYQARSSSQRKELFKEMQEEKKLPACQLLLDMKVRWGSTYVMLNRAEERREVRYLILLILYLNHYLDSRRLCSSNWTTRKECGEAPENPESSAH
jgi:hypothetical protein